MDLGINGKIALVTAASRGLGRGCAEQLAAEKCRVSICSRDGATAKQAAEKISTKTGTEVLGFGADVSKAEDISRLLEEVKQSLGDPEILVTNAGGPPPGTFASTALEQYEKAASSLERTLYELKMGRDPVMWLLAATYAHLGRQQEAEEVLTEYMKKRGYKGYTVERVLKIYLHAFKDPKDTARFAKGLHKAGLPMK